MTKHEKNAVKTVTRLTAKYPAGTAMTVSDKVLFDKANAVVNSLNGTAGAQNDSATDVSGNGKVSARNPSPIAPIARNMASIAALIGTASADEQNAFARPIAANVLDGTKGTWKTKDGKTTKDRKLAKLDTMNRPIPVPTKGLANVVINGQTVKGVDALEITRIRRAYAIDEWGTLAAIDAECKRLKKRELSQAEIDKVLKGLSKTIVSTGAFSPQYTKAGALGAQYARHIAVLQETLVNRSLNGTNGNKK